jgi:hypothetical protein
MKLSLLALLFPLAATAFQAPSPPPALPVKRTTELAATKNKSSNPMENFLRGLANNFEPLHGHGSLEKDLDEQWDAQQALLKTRKEKNIDKEHLKQKYKNPENVTFDLKVGLDTSKSASKKRRFSP